MNNKSKKKYDEQNMKTITTKKYKRLKSTKDRVESESRMKIYYNKKCEYISSGNSN